MGSQGSFGKSGLRDRQFGRSRTDFEVNLTLLDTSLKVFLESTVWVVYSSKNHTNIIHYVGYSYTRFPSKSSVHVMRAVPLKAFRLSS
eukprot:m.146266 g.146266  ORF g.146266 m.146266 type:complete len:88 (+) comp14966_c0_seq14:1101-1364(+)